MLDDWESQEIDRLHGLLEQERAKLRDLIDILASWSIWAEHSPDGWLVIDERHEAQLELVSA